MASSAVTRRQNLVLAFIAAAAFIATATFVPAAVPLFVAPIRAAPAGKLCAVDDTALDIFEHAGLAATTTSVNAQGFNHPVIWIDAEGGVAHAEGAVLTG